MARCNRCDGYVSQDYVRVFGNNEDHLESCPDCRSGWDNGKDQQEDLTEAKLTFRMSDFETDEPSTQTNDTEVPTPRQTPGRLVRVGRAVSGLF